LFRAMSVLRTARLLAISSGTTVSVFFCFVVLLHELWSRLFFFLLLRELDHYALA